MSYRIYTTDALVCGSYDRNTADKNYLLFTETLGMVYATARSVREERSRQRYALQDFSLVRISLVKGKAGWRVGSVVAGINVFQGASDRAARGRIVRIVRLLRRFVHGEEAAADLFRVTSEALQALAYGEVRYPDVYIESVLFRMLYILGYIAPHAEQQILLESTVADLDVAVSDAQLQAVRRAVEEASAISQL